MRDPTPVTTRIIVIERGSTRMFTPTWSDPTEIQSKRWTIWRRWAGARARSCARAPRLTANDTATASTASQPELSRKRLPKNRLVAEAKSGRAGTSQIRLSMDGSPLQEVRVVDVRALALAEDRDDDRETDHALRRGHHHREERQHLAGQVPVQAGERDQREVHGVELQLDRHEDHQRVPAHQHPDRADREQDRRERQEVGDRRAHGTGSRSRSPSTGRTSGGGT